MDGQNDEFDDWMTDEPKIEQSRPVNQPLRADDDDLSFIGLLVELWRRRKKWRARRPESNEDDNASPRPPRKGGGGLVMLGPSRQSWPAEEENAIEKTADSAPPAPRREQPAAAGSPTLDDVVERLWAEVKGGAAPRPDTVQSTALDDDDPCAPKNDMGQETEVVEEEAAYAEERGDPTEAPASANEAGDEQAPAEDGNSESDAWGNEDAGDQDDGQAGDGWDDGWESGGESSGDFDSPDGQ